MLIHGNDPSLLWISKERLAVSRIRDALKQCPSVIMMGNSGVGKTTALLQLAADNPDVQYINCRKRHDCAELDELTCFGDNLTVLVDEVQMIDPSDGVVSNLTQKADETPSFKVVISGSLVGHMHQIARQKSTEEHIKVRMPMLTYLEYLHLIGAISSYEACLRDVDYADTFQDYMALKGMEHLGVGSIGLQQIGEESFKIAAALHNTDLGTSLLDNDSNVIFRAYILLALKLAENWDRGTAFHNPNVQGFSAYKAASSIMSQLEIAQAVKHLLCSQLAVYIQQASSYGEKENGALWEILFGYSEVFAKKYLKGVFTKGTIDAVNPLVYSSFSDELWNAIYESAPFAEISKARERLPANDCAIEDKSMAQFWRESYLRGAFCLASESPFIYTTFLKSHTEKDVDIMGGNMTFDALIKCDLGDESVSAKEVSFEALHSKNRRCVIATKSEMGVEDAVLHARSISGSGGNAYLEDFI
jgi:hypothetical protein